MMDKVKKALNDIFTETDTCAFNLGRGLVWAGKS